MTPRITAQLVRSIGRAVGLDRVGIAPAGPISPVHYYKAWLAAGHAGTMEYLQRNISARQDPSQLLPGARSVICAALSHHRSAVVPPGSRRPMGRVAAYAQGRDYHVVLRGLLAELVERLRAQSAEDFEARICVDTAPLLERELARAAGIGWIGKNTCILTREFGSYVFLGEVLTTLELTPDDPLTDHCAHCTRCLDACPTKALVVPYQLDASRCISYLTIEHRGPIPDEFHAAMGNWVFGCDVCQEVCPYNRQAPLATHPEIITQRTPAFVDLLRLLGLRSAEYRHLTNGSAARRARRSMWRRNAAIAVANADIRGGHVTDEVRQALAAAVHDDDPSVRQAAARSLERLGPRPA